MEGITVDSPSNSTNYNETFYAYDTAASLIYNVVSFAICGIGLPLTLAAIYAVYSMIRNDEVAPVYIINLLFSDIIQLSCLFFLLLKPKNKGTYLFLIFFYHVGLIASICFMVCIALERYLVIVFPLWYRFRRTIKISVKVCIAAWAFCLLSVIPFFVWTSYDDTIFAIIFILPLPLCIFFLGGTLKALSASRVPSDEKHRIVGVLVLVLLIYTLLFLPTFIYIVTPEKKLILYDLSTVCLQLSPLADLFLYVFMRKGVTVRLLACVCCSRTDNTLSDSGVSRTLNIDN